MVMFYDEYSSKSFKNAVEKYLGSQIVQPAITQFDNNVSEPSNNIMKPTMSKQIVQMPSGQFPKILFLTTLSNHYDILGRCRSFEDVLFIVNALLFLIFATLQFDFFISRGCVISP